MGHVGVYNFLLAAMGNVVSALLMYALQVAWLCQRLIDQDYRQNHGSRLTPILDGKDISKPVEIVTTPSEFVLPKSNHYRLKPRQGTKTKKVDAANGDATKSQRGDDRKRKYGRRIRAEDTMANQKLNMSHPYLENSSDSLTMEYMNGLDRGFGLRRAFSDINLSCHRSKDAYLEPNRGHLAARGTNPEEASQNSVTEKDFVRLIFTKGYVT